MRKRFGSRLSGRGLFGVGMRSFSLLLLLVCAAPVHAQDVRKAAEAEGKLVFYASFNASDSKALIDGFRQVYPKIDGTFYRSTDAQLMERILTESRAGQPLWDVVMTTNFYGYNMKKRNLLAVYDSPERKAFRDGWRRPPANTASQAPGTAAPAGNATKGDGSAARKGAAYSGAGRQRPSRGHALHG